MTSVKINDPANYIGDQKANQQTNLVRLRSSLSRSISTQEISDIPSGAHGLLSQILMAMMGQITLKSLDRTSPRRIRDVSRSFLECRASEFLLTFFNRKPLGFPFWITFFQAPRPQTLVANLFDGFNREQAIGATTIGNNFLILRQRI